MRGKAVECTALLDLVVAALAPPIDRAIAAVASGFKILEVPEALKPFSSSEASGNVIGESVVDDLGLIGGFIGVGLATIDVRLVT